MRIIDISPLVTESSPVYPGDDPLFIKLASSSNTIVGTFKMSAHLGAHIDAQLYLKRLGDVSGIKLSKLIGPCQVMEVNKHGAIEVRDLHEVRSCRVLLKTGFKRQTKWTSDFAYLSVQAVKHLAAAGVHLIGIDTPSIDPESDENLSSHVLAIDSGILILENLDLTEVRSGLYRLIALPLKIKGLEASPVRAVLIDDKENPIEECF